MTEVAATVCGVTKGKCRQRETWWWWCDEVEKAVKSKSRSSRNGRKLKNVRKM